MAMGNQTLGRGKLYFSLFKTGTYTPAGFRWLGNTPEFNLTIDNQKLEHFSSDAGIRVKDKSIILETTQTGSLVCDDIQLENLALFFFGSAAALAQTALTAQTETINPVVQGQMYQIGVSDALPTGIRSITNVVITGKVVNVDYSVDLELGLLTIIAGGSIASASSVTVAYDRSAKSRTQVISGTSQVQGAILYISANPEGDKMDYLMPYVRLSPNGDFALKSDEWQKMPLSVEILTAPNRAAIYVDGRPL
jgi:hypothetical protein